MGRVLPGTLEDVTLCAEVRRLRRDGAVEVVTVEGESLLPKAGGQIERVYLKQERAHPEAICPAILQGGLDRGWAGSFFTSVLPNLLVTGVRDAICASRAPGPSTCATWRPRPVKPTITASATIWQSCAETRRRGVPQRAANDNYGAGPPPSGQCAVGASAAGAEPLAYRLFTGDVVDDARPWRDHFAELGRTHHGGVRRTACGAGRAKLTRGRHAAGPSELAC